MAVGTAYSCASLPTWAVAQCCQGCHGATNDVRPVRLVFGAGYPAGSGVQLAPPGSTYVVCCRAQLHGIMAMGADAQLDLNGLGLPT